MGPPDPAGGYGALTGLLANLEWIDNDAGYLLRLDGVGALARTAPRTFDVVHDSPAVLGWFGPMPTNPRFGALSMPMGNGNQGHSNYFEEGSYARDFMVRIIRGDYRQACFSPSSPEYQQ